jgi:hypothetical protein
MQLPLAEIRATGLGPCHFQHLRADVDADDCMAE